MSQSNYIPNLLNIKDKNVKLNKNYQFYEKFDNIVYKVIEDNLSYEPILCTRCGFIFNNISPSNRTWASSS